MLIFTRTKILLTILCLLSTAHFAAAQTTVFVSILPQKFFVEKIAGDKVNVEVMVPPGASPATYEPKPSQMRKLNNADIYFSIGVPFEHAWLDRISKLNKDMKIVATDDGVVKRHMRGHQHHDHDEHQHDHEAGKDPHIWLSPLIADQIAQNILMALQQAMPEDKEFFTQNYHTFSDKIKDLDQKLKSLLSANESFSFMVFHPSWGYFADQYELEQIPIELEGKKVKAAKLQELIKYGQEHSVRFIFAQPQFSQKEAKVIAREIDAELIIIDPLAENWLTNLHDVAKRIDQTLGDK